MNRRSFTASLAALFAAPALPAVASLAPATAVTQTTATQYATAKLLVRAHNSCSPAMLQRLMRVESAIARELNALLFDRGVISAAGAQGSSIALNPLNTNCIPNEAMRASNFAQKMQNAKARLEKVSKALKQAEVEEADVAKGQSESTLRDQEGSGETSEHVDDER